jgi:hypothetical protein
MFDSETLRRLLGITPSAAKDIDRAQFYFAGGWPIRSVVIVLAVAALWFAFFYLRDGKRPSLWVKVPLLCLRLVAVAALLVMLLQPMLRLRHSERQRSTVLVLADTSESMSFKDSRLPADRAGRVRGLVGADPRGLTRAEIVERAANAPANNLVAALRKQYNVRLYNFNAQPQPVSLAAVDKGGNTLRVVPDTKKGTSTQIGAALKRALDDAAGQQVSGALLLSDGGHNLGDDPVSVAERAKQQGIPVSAVGVGDPTPTRDLAITETLADQVARKEGTVEVFVGLAHRGYEGKPVAVTLRRRAEVVGTKSVTLGPAAKKQTASFRFVPKQTGNFTYTATVTTLNGEVTAANNRRQFLQRVIDKKLKILYVDGEPRWEYRYLKNAILRDKQIEFSCYLSIFGPRLGGEGNVPIEGFPKDEKTLFAYDILILGDVPRTHFTELQIRNIRRFVEDKGSSLIVIAGEKHMPHEYRGTVLDAVFPVVLPALPEQVKTEEPYKWEITAEGRQDPLLRLDDDSAKSDRIWRELPGMFWNAGVERAKPGATVLAVNSARSNSSGKRVVLAVQSFGAGRCLMSLADTTWRWRWRVGDRYFYRYWGQALRAMTPHETPDGNRYAQINADRAEYLLTDRVSLHARLLDTFYRPIKDPKVTATLRGETGAPVQLTLNAVPGSPGLFGADYFADRTGKFQVQVASPANPAGKATATFLVQSVALEKQQPEMNETLLKKIAAAGGGAYYHPDEMRKWINSLKAKDLVVTSETEIELWDAPLFLMLFIVPLGLEWFIRKRAGML